MELSFIQMLALSLLGAVSILDQLGLNFGFQGTTILGAVAGLICGDLATGLMVGATLNLMGLGVSSYGGASVPDYKTAAIVGTAFGVMSGKGLDFSIGIAIPVALLMVQLDILARLCNTFFLHRVDAAIERVDTRSVSRNILLGYFSWGLSRFIPIALMLFLGQATVQAVVDNLPMWLMGGLKVAGGVLPVVGIAILLKYLPVKRYLSFLLVGFFLAAYLSVPVLGAAIVGVAAALLTFHQEMDKSNRSVAVAAAAATQATTNELEGADDDEYED